MQGGTRRFSPELICLGAFRQARADFFDAVVETAEAWRLSRGEPDLLWQERKLLRSEGVAQIAEFFFVLRDAGLTSPAALASFLSRHNADMQALLDSCSRGYTRFGLSAARIKGAMFEPHQVELILHESAGDTVTFDQRSLGKVLTQVMSFESCRTLVVLLASTGLLQRRDFRALVLISSNGTIESLFGQHLRSIVKEISALGSDAR
jgi:hypothetical protein